MRAQVVGMAVGCGLGLGVVVGCGGDDDGSGGAVDAGGTIDAGGALDADPTAPDATIDAGGTLIFAASFQDGTLPASLRELEAVADGVTVAVAPWDASRKALRTTVRVGEDWNGTGTPRSEAVPLDGDAPLVFELDHTYRITTAIWFDEGVQFGDLDMSAGFQIRPTESGAAVQVMLMVAEGTMFGVVGDEISGNQYFTVGAVPTGERVAVDLLYRPSSSSIGLVQLRLGDELVIDLSGPNNPAARPNGGSLYLGQQDYNATVPELQQVHLDDLEIRELE